MSVEGLKIEERGPLRLCLTNELKEELRKTKCAAIDLG
jgi:hypothetical protein